MILIYSPRKSSRLEYITAHIVRNIWGSDSKITSDKELFSGYEGPSINYSNEPLNKGIRITPKDDFLFETGIYPERTVEIGRWNELFCFFLTSDGDIPFDLFAASFYLISRYEEYFPLPKDIHGRYDPQYSLLVRNGLIETPIMDRWAWRLKEYLIKSGCPESEFKPRSFRVINTFDIDHPFMFRNKGIAINLLGGVKDLCGENSDQLKARIKTVLHLREDPYFEALDRIDRFQKSWDREYYLFILLGKYEARGRRTIYPLRRFFRYLRRTDHTVIGLHPSYSGAFDEKEILREKKRLEQLINLPVKTNRQHYLRIRIPETCRQLIRAGFTDDFTLIHSAFPGFRAGTSIPFYFYDLDTETTTSLLMHPTAVMDTTLIGQMKLSVDEALHKIRQLADACKEVGGDFIMLWHNSNLAEISSPNPWITVFEKASEYAFSLETGSHPEENFFSA